MNTYCTHCDKHHYVALRAGTWVASLIVAGLLGAAFATTPAGWLLILATGALLARLIDAFLDRLLANCPDCGRLFAVAEAAARVARLP